MLVHKQLFAIAVVTLFSTSICKEDIVEELINRFNSNVNDCIDQHNHIRRPAYECSGLLVRGVRYDEVHRNLKYPWSLKARNHGKTSFSVTFLRKDNPFNKFPSGYDSGFIVYPHLRTPQGKRSNRVYCAFPLDGHTDGRGGRHGCGQSRDDPVGTSRHCDAQGITSFDKWKKHYNKIRKSRAYFVRRQCAFDMTLPTAARDFAIVMQANDFIRTNRDAKKAKYSYRVNELLLEEWNQDDSREIPIEAFFYLHDSHGAREKARMYQEDYHWMSGGENIPVISIRLPTPSKPNVNIELDRAYPPQHTQSTTNASAPKPSQGSQNSRGINPTIVNRPVQPLNGPTQPLNRPVQPLNRPTQPLNHPVQPLNRPTQPLNRPVQPLNGPTQPLNHPVQPLNRPTQPLNRPVQPLNRPTQPLIPQPRWWQIG